MADIDPLAFQRGFQGALNIADTARQNRLAQLVFDQKQQELADQQSTNNALSAFYQRGDTPESRQQLYGQLPGSKIIATQKTLTEADTARQAQQKAQRDQLIAQFDWADKNMAAVQDQAGWDAFRQRAATVYPDIAAKLPAVYDPAAVAASRAKAIPVLEQWKAENTANENRLNREATASNSAANRAATAEQGALNREATAEQGRLNREAQAGKAGAKEAQGEKQRVQDANDALGLIEMADKLLNDATGSRLGNAIDVGAGALGISTPGAQAGAQLKALEGALVSKMPKMSGPQSDKDVLLYRQMAAQIGDANLPVATRRAALNTVRKIQQKYAAGSSSTPGGKPKPSLADIFGN